MSAVLPDAPLLAALRALATGEPLGAEDVRAAFDAIMRGDAEPLQAAGLLMALRARGETPEQVAGVVRALRGAMIPVQPPDGPVIDTAGTGGGRVGTFNVSTAAAIIAAAAGAVVAKHGNRSYTSRCGSADVLEALGVSIQLDADRAARTLHEVGMVFLYAPAFHPAMRHLAPVRKALGVPTIMNLVGPLANPAGVRRQVIGVADADRGPLVAHALDLLGVDHALVVHARVGMDEIAPSGTTQVWEVREGSVRRWEIDPEALGWAVDDLDALAGGDPPENARRLERLLAEPDADRAGAAAAVLNAAAAVYVAGLEGSLPSALARARDALWSGAAAERLTQMVAASNAG